MRRKAFEGTLHDLHFGRDGQPKKRFSSYWEADRYIERGHQIDAQAYYCRICGGVHLATSPKVVTNSVKLPGF